MGYIITLLILSILISVLHYYIKRRNKEKKVESFKKKWGNKKSDEYFNFHYIRSYFDIDSKNEHFHILSDKTVEDLDINHVFKVIDRTSSKIGQQFLYYKLRTPKNDLNSLKKFNDLVNSFLEKTNESVRIDCQIELSKLNSHDSYNFSRLISDTVQKPKKILTQFLFLSVFLQVLFVILIFLGFRVFFFPLLFLFIINLFLHFKNKYSISFHLKNLYVFSRAINVAIVFSRINKIKYFFEDISFINRLKKIDKKIRFISLEKRLNDNEFFIIIWFIFEFIKIFFNIETIIFHLYVNALSKEKEDINKLFRFLGTIDSAISIASLRSDKFVVCLPQFDNQIKIFAKDITHPLIDNCIPNTINEKNSVLLTGSNMSGKTTFIRTIAINSILSQTIFTCFANEFKTPFYKIYTSIRISDDITNNTSYYFEEVLQIKNMINQSSNYGKCLFVLDEIFKGTNTIERLSAGQAILNYLNNQNHLVIVATHDVELTHLLKENNYSLYYFQEVINNNNLYFDNKLKKGVLSITNGIKILDLFDYPKIITNKANEIKEELENNMSQLTTLTILN
jgi:DNA mismatch repair ATPase MutS